jgi:hypothetical protein
VQWLKPSTLQPGGECDKKLRHMSALGQKQTYAVQQPMSALLPIATAKANSRNRPCPLYPQERTCAMQLRMSALGHKRTIALVNADHLAD